MRTIASLCTTLAVVLAAAGEVRGPTQHVWQADVSVRELALTLAERGPTVTARVVVAADSDDARAVRLEVMLPVGVAVVRMPNVCHTSPSPVTSLSARVTCALGDLPVRESRGVSITTTDMPGARGRLRFAAFAFSDTPDPAPANNFVERVFR
jgi:hypothetical protein